MAATQTHRFRSEEGVDGAAPVDAQNASTSRLENPHRTRVSHTAHAHYFLGSKKKTKDRDVTRARLTLHPGIINFLTGRIREDPSEELWNYVSTNTIHINLRVSSAAAHGRTGR